MKPLDDETLTAFVDGELDGETAKAVERQLARDPQAYARAQRLRRSAELIRAAFEDPIYKRVPASLAHFPRRSVRAVVAARPRAWAAAAAIVLALAGFGAGFGVANLVPPSFSDRLFDEVADYHVVYARETEHQVEVPAAQRPHIEAWLGDRLKRRLVIPDLSRHDLTFRGARLLVVDGQPVAQLLYEPKGRPQQPLGLCISFGGAAGSVQTDSREGVNLLLWQSKGYSYVIVGWFEPKFLSELAVELRPELDRG